MLELGVIADDLTGGMMVASLLEREGGALSTGNIW